MTIKAGKSIVIIVAVFALWLVGAGPLQAADMYDPMYRYTKIPPFIEVGLDPNLLMVIDNSASMYDPAHRNPQGDNYCYARANEDIDGDGVIDADLLNDGAVTKTDTEDINGNGTLDVTYDNTVPYAGSFDTDDASWYVYKSSSATMPGYTAGDKDEFVKVAAATGQAWCTDKGGTVYTNSELCLAIDGTTSPKTFKAFAASGRFLNWLMASKFDVEKKVLTGGKYDSTNAQIVMESRGCDTKRFIKDIPVSNGGSFYVATFGIRSPTDSELANDQAYNGAISNTRLDIYQVLATGMNFTGCAAAIDAFANGNLGTVKSTTEDCLDPMNTGLFASGTAFNHIMQECWYYNKFGGWQPGGGTVQSLRNDCEQVYNVAPGTTLPAAGFVSPSSLSTSDVCYGTYVMPGPHASGPWGVGYVGQCWETTFTYLGGGGYAYTYATCSGYSFPADGSQKCCSGGSPVAGCSAGYVYYCNGNYNSNTGACVGNPGTWARLQIAYPLTTGGWESKVGWTNDNSNDNGDACIDYALKKYCQGIDEQTTVDPSDYTNSMGDVSGLPALLVDSASQAQLGAPLFSAVGRLQAGSAPSGLIQEFKYNLRMGAMQFNTGTKSECKPVESPAGSGRYIASLYDCLAQKGSAITVASTPDPAQLDGGKIVSYIDDGDDHIDNLVTAINAISATAWTPLAEAYLEAVGYYTQRTGRRLNAGDYVCDQDGLTAPASYPAWAANTAYAAGARVRFAWDYDDNGLTDETKVYFTDQGGTSSAGATTIDGDKGVRWTPFDPVLAGCQKNYILLITDGGSTADLHSTMTDFVRTAGNNDGDSAATYAAGILEPANYECKTTTGLSGLYGSSLLDDLSYYANRNDSDIFAYPTVDNLDKQPITTYVVAAGTLQDDGTGYDCNPKTQLQEVADNSGTTLFTDPDMLEGNLRYIFAAIGGEPASGSAASVISNSRSGEGAIFQAVFYPNQEDQNGRKISWAGDVHALWLDEWGNIREDCGSGGCAVGDEDALLDKQVDRILQFYTDPISSAARARAFSDANGDGHYDPAAPAAENINLRDIPYIWSAGKWLSEVLEADVATQRLYNSPAKQRHILTSLDGTSMIDFTPTALSNGLGASAYYGYFGFGAANPANVDAAAKLDEANDIIYYIRGDDTRFLPDNVTERGYRSRLIDWFGNNTPKVWKLGDVVNSTPTVVSTPAEDYDLIYGDTSYQEFRRRYRNRRAMVYAGGNDGGLHAFNGGYYDRATDSIDKAPPRDLTEVADKVEYDLGAEMWMFVPKNVFPHLKWLTAAKYSHVNYVDFKPYIFDAKIFTPSATHPQGWGTLLVGGMGFGGGDIGVDTDADGVADDATMRASYFILDITNPEAPPTILREFTHADLGYTIGSPTAIPMLLCTLKVDCPTDQSVITWPMDWFLALPSGPHAATPEAALNGKSDQDAKIFTLPLGGTASGHLGYAGSAFAPDVVIFPVANADAPNSFFSDVIAVDYDLDFKTDTLYFGSVANAHHDTTSLHTGGLHRLVTGENHDRAAWGLNTFFKTPGKQPISGSPSVAYDGQRAWVYFGTGRYYSAQLDKDNTAQQSYYGIKENYTDLGVLDLSAPSDGNLVDVSKVWVEDGTGELHLTSGALPLKATDYAGPADLDAITSLDAATFKELDLEMSEKASGLDEYNGWKLDFDLAGERNLGQAAILGNIVTFTTYVPSEDFCQPEGESFLWASYYRTGTAYSKPVIGNNPDRTSEVLRKISVGVGLASTPNIHSGAEAGSTAFVQTSTGAIVSVQQDNPGVVKSGMTSWRELGE